MKTAISIPDEIFERAERGAGVLGVSRSEFFARAAVRYLDHLEAQSLTRQIDAALAAAADDDSNDYAVELSKRTLRTEPEW